ncbi:VOC family protein [Gordonia soli]|uniref:VOC domain-containing protein n=1 Tax=Gordonia soli NBRC 108243 TaxID=1223545 RepID=M0QKX4_9ACTN|nr:hypothetical protein [Gordonia soli]GAC69213.1 hypothetical protein GS4_23_00070 [Gordonia soli NBRC 108243]
MATTNTVNGFVVTDNAADLINFLIAVFDAVEDPDAHTPDYAAADGTLIHSEIHIGNSILMVADRKSDWPFTPALTQVYVDDAAGVLRRATARGARVVTDIAPFYGGYSIARFVDPWHNVWWLFAPEVDNPPVIAADTSENGSVVYTTLLDTMRDLTDPRDAASIS